MTYLQHSTVFGQILEVDLYVYRDRNFNAWFLKMCHKKSCVLWDYWTDLRPKPWPLNSVWGRFCNSSTWWFPFDVFESTWVSRKRVCFRYLPSFHVVMSLDSYPVRIRTILKAWFWSWGLWMTAAKKKMRGLRTTVLEALNNGEWAANAILKMSVVLDF